MITNRNAVQYRILQITEALPKTLMIGASRPRRFPSHDARHAASLRWGACPMVSWSRVSSLVWVCEENVDAA